MEKIRLNQDTVLSKDGSTWCVLVGKNIQEGELYYAEDGSMIGAISKWAYEETNCYEPDAVSNILPDVIYNLCNIELEGTSDEE